MPALYPDQRAALCSDSLAGLSAGDALGAQFFVPENDRDALLSDGILPLAPWPWTDDTEMACTVAAEVVEHGAVDQDRIAAAFADRCDPYRRYGAGAVQTLRQIRDGVPWREAAVAAFPTGSFGNGAAMRIAQLGAYFVGDLDRAVSEAITASEVTHAHPEGIGGGVLVAVATAFVAQARLDGRAPEAGEVLDAVGRYERREALPGWVGSPSV